MGGAGNGAEVDAGAGTDPAADTVAEMGADI